MDTETKQAFDLVLSELKEMKSDINEMKSEINEIKSDIVVMKSDISEIKTTMATKDQVASVMIALNNSNFDLNARDNELERAIKQNSYDIVKLRAAQ